MNSINQQNNSVSKTETVTTMSAVVAIETKSFKRRGKLQQKVRKLRYWQSLKLIRGFSWKQRLTSLLLMVSIFSTTVAASPDAVRTMFVSSGEFYQDIRFGMAAYSPGGSTLASVLSGVYGFFLKPAGRQQNVERVVILPGDNKGNLTIMQGEQVNFTAIGLIRDQPQSGLAVKWSLTDTLRRSQAKSLNNGIFKAVRPGIFAIAAAVGGVQSQVIVTVLPNEGLGIQRLLQKNDAQKNDREKQGLNKMLVENKLIARDISSKQNYNRAEELQRDEVFKQKRDEVKAKQEQRRNRQPNPLQVSSGNEANEFKPEGIDRADAEGTVDEERLASINRDVATESEPAAKTLETIVSAPFRPADEDGWNGGNWWEADNPNNQTGNPPGTSPDLGGGNGNFQFSAPVVALPGRGMDINLSLSYNSRLWSKAGNQMIFDADKGNPAPGWNLGFGKMIYMGSNGGCMLVDADGTRRAYTGTNSTYSSGSYFSNSFTGHTADGSFIDYNCYYSSSSYGTYFSGWATLPNGTTVSYNSQSFANDQVYPTSITDAQGNFITITYQNNRGPNIQTVIDTMGRVITFNYDTLNRLISVTVPGFNYGPARTAVRLHYSALTLNPGFAGGISTDTNNNTPYVLDAIYYPGTNTGYWFGDTDSYSSYGMIAKVKEMRGMTSTGSTNDQGNVTAGIMSKQAVYDYPLTPNYTLTDAPTYANLTESWDGMDTAPAVTNYQAFMNSNPRTITVTQPNGVKSKQYMYNTTGVSADAWKDGLIYLDETLDGSNNILSRSEVTWQQGNYDSARPIVTVVTDERQQTLRTELTYGTNVYNQVTSKKEFDYNNGPLLRETRSMYENSTLYTSTRHIFNLVKSNEVYNGAGVRVAKTDYEYDNNVIVGVNNHNLKPATGVIMHDYMFDPFTTETVDGSTCLNGQFNDEQCSYVGQTFWTSEEGGYEVVCEFLCNEYEQVSAYWEYNAYRGNVTKITSYADAQNTTPTQAVVSTKQYDVTGNLVNESASCCELKTYTYDITTQFAYPIQASRGSSNPNSSIRNLSAATYDFNTGLVKTSTDPNNRTDTTIYDVNTLRPIQTNSSTLAYSQTFYDDTAMTITSETHEYGGNLAGKTVRYLNGIGKAKSVESFGENNIPDRVDTKYTNLGQVWKQTNPYRGSETLFWTENVYDLLGRTIQVKSLDQNSQPTSSSFASYNELARPDSASNLPGETIRQTDAWGRERWSRTDALGRMVEVVEPNPNGNGTMAAGGTMVTNYEYNILNNLTRTIQGTLPNQQIREFKYDTLGRITRQKLAEQSATIRDDGVYVGEGGAGAYWSSAVLQYDSRSNVIQAMDARGVKTNYSYQLNGEDDPLNRLRSVSYDKSGAYQPTLIPDASPITLSYMTAGDQDRIAQVQTSWTTEVNTYNDPEGRISDYTITLPSGQPLTTSYVYDSLSRVKEVRYPAQYGVAGNPRKLVMANYDVASRMKELKVDNQIQMNAILYNSKSQVEAVTIGAGTGNADIEEYSYDQQTGLLTNQIVKKAGNNQQLLNLTYSYNKNASSGTGTGKTGALTQIINNLDPSKNKVYEYDALGRLKTAKGGLAAGATAVTANWTQIYDYDRWGNRTTVNVLPSSVTNNNQPVPTDGLATLSYQQTSNRINTAGYQYDPSGNLIRGQAADGSWQHYEFDAANRLVNVYADNAGNRGANIQGSGYSSSNRRLVTNDAEGLKWYVWGGDSVMAEYTSTAWATPLTWQKSYVYAGDSLLSTYTNNNSGGETLEFHHPDRLGTKLVTNHSNNALNYEQSTLPYGTALTAEDVGTSTTNRKFTSYQRSNVTKLDYAVNRSYSSAQGRFTQVDPIGMQAASLIAPQTLNLYSYCGNDSINRTDPDGQFWGAIGRFFSKIGNAIMKVFSNRIFLIAVAIISAIVAVGTVYFAFMSITAHTAIPTWFTILAGVSSAVTTISGIASAVGTTLQVSGIVLQGNWNALWQVSWKSVLSAAAGVIEDFIRLEIENLRSVGGFFGALGRGFFKGFKALFADEGAWLARGFESLFPPIYGGFCGGSWGIGVNFWGAKIQGPIDSVGPTGNNPPIDGLDNACKTHDTEYNKAKKDFRLTGDKDALRSAKLGADLKLIKSAFAAGTRLHLVDIAFGFKSGDVYRVGLIPAFGVTATARKLKLF